MKARNLHPFVIVTVISMAIGGCQSGDSLAVDSANVNTDNAYGADSESSYIDEQNEAPQSAPGPSLKTVAIMDQVGAGQPMQAASISIPANWQAEGGIGWDRSIPCIGNQMRFQWQATSPDGSQAFSVMPGMSWQVQGTQMQMNPCPAMPFRSAQDLLSAIVQQQRSGARILQYRPKAAQANPGGQGNARVDAGAMLVGYQRDGQEMREVFSTSVTFTQMQGNVVGGAATVTALRAPNGQLDFGLAESISASMKADRRWLAESGKITQQSLDSFTRRQSGQISDWNDREMAGINARGAADRATIRSNTARDVANINSQTYANTSATDDNIQRRTLEGIGSYNTYNDPAGGNTVQADIGYDRVIRNDNGTYTGTNDPYYNPAGSAELERQQ